MERTNRREYLDEVAHLDAESPGDFRCFTAPADGDFSEKTAGPLRADGAAVGRYIDAAIGPSFLMTKSITAPGRLERIWAHAILPLLEERFYGTGEDLSRFSLAALRSAISANP